MYMRLPLRFVSLLLLFSLVPMPLFAQIATSTASTTAQAASNSSNNSSLGIGLGIGVGLLGLGLLSSFGSSAATIPAARLSLSFGGRIIAAIPCVSGLGPSIFVTIRPAGVFAPTYIWTPLTITKLTGPPRTIGQQILGRADIPFACFIPTVPPIFFYGLRMQTVGTSLY